MVYLVSSIGKQAFATIKSAYPQYSESFTSVEQLNKFIVTKGLSDSLNAIVIVAPVLENSVHSSEMLKLSATLKSTRPNMKIIAGYTDSEAMNFWKEKIESLFQNVVYYNLPGNNLLVSQFGELLEAKKDEIVDVDNNPPKLKIGILGLDTGSGNFTVSSSISYLVSKRVRGKVALLETSLSLPRISEFFDNTRAESSFKKFSDTGVFDVSSLDFITSNFGFGSIDHASRGNLKSLVPYVKAIRGVEFAFIDIGSNPKILEQDILMDELNEIWVVLSPSPRVHKMNIPDLIPSKLAGKVQIILNKMDEYSSFIVQKEAMLDGHEGHILCQVPIIESNWISRSLWEKRILPQIPEYVNTLTTLFDAPVKRVIRSS